MKVLQFIALLSLTLSGYVQAIVNGKAAAVNDWRSVVLLELNNSGNGQQTSCTGVIISESYVVTTASCVLNRETGKLASKVKVCIGQKRPFKTSVDSCIETEQIYSHHGYTNASVTSVANNLAYIKFKKPLNLTKLKVKPAIPVTPDEFSELISNATFPEITWVGFDSDGIQQKAQGIKQQGTVLGAEYDYQSRSIQVTSSGPRPGNHYRGMASFIHTQAGEWRLAGVISQSTPDNLVTYHPEINPSEEDQIIVRYPKPIMQVMTSISIYPVAACGMVGFIPAEGFDELSCKRLLLKKLDWSAAIQADNPRALRQRAIHIYNNSNAMDDAGEIYKMLHSAYQAGDQKAGLTLAEYLLEGRLFAKDTDTVRLLIEALIERDDPSANLLLAKLMLFPSENRDIAPSSEARDKTIFGLLQKSAKSGLADAQYLLGRLHQLGIGTKKNHRKAYNWYAQAAMQAHAEGQFQLGMQWKDGRGVRSYLEVAEFWIQQAAAQGHLEAQNRIGLLKPVANQ